MLGGWDLATACLPLVSPLVSDLAARFFQVRATAKFCGAPCLAYNVSSPLFANQLVLMRDCQALAAEEGSPHHAALPLVPQVSNAEGRGRGMSGSR